MPPLLQAIFTNCVNAARAGPQHANVHGGYSLIFISGSFGLEFTVRLTAPAAGAGGAFDFEGQTVQVCPSPKNAHDYVIRDLDMR